MDFSFGAPASGAGGGGASLAELGPELPDLSTNEVGFKGVCGDCNIQLLPTAWPADAPPAPTCSLFTVASTSGLVVGAGPDCLVVATASSVRDAISASTNGGETKTKPFQPAATIPLPGRPTHVAFCAGNSALVLATENGPQLSIFQTATLLQGNAQPALSVPTDGATFRALVPNPAPSSEPQSNFVALVTTDGRLLVADLKAGALVNGPNGRVLKSNVSTVAWSNKGKQLVAGLDNGTGCQMTPEGVQKDLIPRPPKLEENCHVSSISWLENDIFLMVYTPNAPEDDMGSNPPSSYYIVTRRKQAPFIFQQLPELCAPFGVKRTPAYQFIARLRDFKPHLNDLLILASTASTDVGLITRSDQPLSRDESAKDLVNKFVMTEVDDDAKRAYLPLKDSANETSVIGLGIDLSSNEIVDSPIQGEDITETSTPLPNFLLLNNEGMLSSWWIIYSESIRQKIPYPGLISVSVPQQQQIQQQPPQPQTQLQPPVPTLQQSRPGPASFGATSTLGMPSSSALSGNHAPAFGSPTSMGVATTSQRQNAVPRFGQSGFGAPSFGQPSTPGKPLSSPPLGTPSFGAASGFGSFANSGGFASLATNKPAGGLLFGKATIDNPFGKPSGPSLLGSGTGAATSFTNQQTGESKGVFGMGPGGFVLGSTFKADGTAANDLAKPETLSGVFSFGRGSLDAIISAPTKPKDSMNDMDEEPSQPRTAAAAGTTAVSSPFGDQVSRVAAPSAPTLFAAETTAQATPATAQTGKPPFSLFGNLSQTSLPSNPLSPASDKTAVPTFMPMTEEQPLPPDATSKMSYGPGDTSASSTVSKSSIEDAPLPPDFMKQVKPALKETMPPQASDLQEPRAVETSTIAEKAALPSDSVSKLPQPAAEELAPIPDGSLADEESEGAYESEGPDESDFADSGEEITHGDGVEEQEDEKDAEEVTEATVGSLKTSFESSFGELTDKSPSDGRFSKVSAPAQARQRPGFQFREVATPAFLPPVSAGNRELPRSPSPARPGIQRSLLRPENQRSSSAPSRSGSTLAARKAMPTMSSLHAAHLADGPTTEEQTRVVHETQRQIEPPLYLSDDDEDERLRADLARPVEPVPSLDPFLPHQDYAGETTMPGIPGQIERLYRDINSMIDTLGINSRSLTGFMLYQESSQVADSEAWSEILKRDRPADLLDQELVLSNLSRLDEFVTVLNQSLQQQRLQGVDEKLEQCQHLLGKDILTLRGQLANIQKTLDAYTDTTAVLSTPLSAEQANIQQELRTSSTTILTKVAELEREVSVLRARIAESHRPDGAANGSNQRRQRPTVEAVISTIGTMMSMAESKSGDIDFLEAQLKKMGIDVSRPVASREHSPLTTPKRAHIHQLRTPGSHRSVDGIGSAYHTPESASRGGGGGFASGINGSTKGSRLRNVEGLTTSIAIAGGEIERWKEKTQLRKHIVQNLKMAIEGRKSKVSNVYDL